MKAKENLPKGGKIKAIRINLICDGIRNGLNYEEIQSRLNNSPDRYISDFRGESSVANVKRVIGQLPLAKYHIMGITEIKPHSYKDEVEKHDLELIASDHDIGIIGIQVKSSIKGIFSFYQHFDQDLDIAKKIALQNKLIVLNGALEDSIVRKNFLTQFQNIYQYFKYKSDN